ncbi:MAG: prepilin-type N-terminal cleavage/methylation domain-containing protein [Sulfuricurvum sp.]|jgi:prepilin-type N-terminal cleavage/methylation domain-containing protein|uniref:PulJ/GspJ family protein n=1 Tax=Sulfuricurvum sp. TaxID=2025608 RepID=UPI0026000FE1|nr:prepilin-type N-terminal cleavage/methylation domain-containing protein [Sulfuricurvum sp.]MCK9372345.1 prepilin-type N-terminal cleavage/methylation domain-containing protein [Sulfuricurvum sp.]
MKREGFTLIELLVSITLFGLIALFLFGSIDNLRKQQVFYQKKEAVLGKKNQILSLLRTDLERTESVSVTTASNKDFDRITINNSNRSLYALNRPFVIWLVLKQDNTLIRLESAAPIKLPLTPESLFLVHSDRIQTHCEYFRLYDALKNRFVYLKFENEPPLMVETSK